MKNKLKKWIKGPVKLIDQYIVDEGEGGKMIATLPMQYAKTHGQILVNLINHAINVDELLAGMKTKNLNMIIEGLSTDSPLDQRQLLEYLLDEGIVKLSPTYKRDIDEEGNPRITLISVDLIPSKTNTNEGN